jgi:ABC-type transporter Mla subunit MlaD
MPIHVDDRSDLNKLADHLGAEIERLNKRVDALVEAVDRLSDVTGIEHSAYAYVRDALNSAGHS